MPLLMKGVTIKSKSIIAGTFQHQPGSVVISCQSKRGKATASRISGRFEFKDFIRGVTSNYYGSS